jgi:hypothetical protein
MVISIIFLAFMLSIPGSSAINQADTMYIPKNINGGKPAIDHLKFNFPKFYGKFSEKNDPKARRKNARPSLEVQAGAGIPEEDCLNTHVASGFGLTIPLKKRLSLSIDLRYCKIPVKEVPTKFYDGHIRAYSFLASLQFSLLRQNRVNPYVLIGGGYIFSSFTMKDIITIPEITIDQSVKNGFCLQGGLGIDLTILHSWRVFTEVAYFYRKTSGITTITDLNFVTSTRKFPVNLQAWIFQIGIKYFVK